uniref:ATP synthase complex subunit 8 n=1 Tax=Sicyonia lancifer TaxID=516899 RepID=A0A345WJ69_9EUCA|nr:ATP synthase F0 subunit 8 [Sicyonia lancifer]AXJ93112.1 ATP synthase F0 subunit 8 [Sicyonia lancifer]
MPQMAPLLWLNLFFLFCATFLGFLIINFFIKVPLRVSKFTPSFKVNQLDWKW